MWVQLLIPRIEDGNNFGVSIQEETVAELRTVEGEAASYLDQISRFYLLWLSFQLKTLVLNCQACNLNTAHFFSL